VTAASPRGADRHWRVGPSVSCRTSPRRPRLTSTRANHSDHAGSCRSTFLSAAVCTALCWDERAAPSLRS